jgi:DNA polymerase-3 subunit delta'
VSSDPSEDADGSVRPARGAAALPWQRAAIAGLLARRPRWPHALLITGQAGIGKRAFADALALALLCEAPRDDGSACGACAGCGYVAAGQHPDLRIIEPVDVNDDEAKPVEWIAVDRIRALTQWAQLTSHRGGAKVALIVPAERMNGSAANALLKTLEEPPADTFFLLVSHQPGRLPPTIVSRCQLIAAPRPTRAQAVEWLAAQRIPGADALLSQANGAPLAARMLADASYQSERAIWMSALAAPRAMSVASLGMRVDAGAREARKDRLAAVIGWLISWCIDIARVRAGAAAVQNHDYARQLAILAPSVAAIPLFRYHRNLLNQRALPAHPLQPRLVAEALLIDYRALFG